MTGFAQANEAPVGSAPGQLEAQRSRRLSATAAALSQTVATLAVEDFRIEDFRYERDCRAGRDLLFLLSNNDWARRTTEVVDVSRVRAVDAKIIVDVDLSYVTHEAFQPEHDLLWLPILALPMERTAGSGAGRPAPPLDARRLDRRRRRSRAESTIPDAITSLEVHDAAGGRVTKVPQGEVHHWLAAALAEALLPQIRPPADPEHRADPRDEVVLLAAAIRRLLQQNLAGSDGSEPPSTASVDRQAPGDGGLRRFDGRLAAARAALAEVFGHDLSQTRPGLASRVMEILHSLIGTVMVVVAVPRGPQPTSFTVRLPSRRLVRSQPSMFRLRPRSRLQVDLLAATSHADRLIRLNLPQGVTWLPSADQARPDVARIEVRPPRPFDQLRALVGQLMVAVDTRVSWVDRRLAELAIDKVHSAAESLRYYRVADGGFAEPGSVRTGAAPAAAGRPIPPDDPTEQLLSRLAGLQERLRVLSRSGGANAPAPIDEIAALAPKRSLHAYWQDGGWLPDLLERRLVTNTASPDAVQVRSPAIEDFTLRAEPMRARLDLDVAVEESIVLDTARDTNAVNLLLLTVVTVLLAWHRGRTDPVDLDVLATVLTLFPAIQASRIERPDVTTLAGLLTQPGYLLSLATAVPAILLAASLAVLPTDAIVFAAVTATAVQALLAMLIRRPAAAVGSASKRAPRLVLGTDHAPDHRGFDVLRSTWCRTLTAEALNLGHPAFAEVVLGPEGPGALGDLLEPAGEDAHLLALFRASAAGSAMTMLVAREELIHRRPGGGGLFRPVPLELGRMVPTDPPEWIIEVLVGIPRSAEPGLTVAEHPVTAVLEAAKASNFRVLFVQYPSPPPRPAHQELVWLRTRIGVPYRRRDTLAGLRRLFIAVRGMQDGPIPGTEIDMQIVPEMATLEATETAPEETFWGAPAPAELRLVANREVEVAAAGEGEVWRPFAFCANARVGLLADVLTRLAARRPGLRVAGVTSAVVHGLSMTFLLCHDPDPVEPAEGRLGRLLTEDLSGTHRLVVPIDGRRLEVDVSVDGTEDRTADRTADRTRQAGPLLRVQVRTGARAGALREVLDWLTRTVQARGVRLGLPAERLDVWSALVRLVDGRAVQGRVTVRLPSDAGAQQGWDSVDWSADAQRSDAIITLDLVRVERRPPAPAHSTQTSPAG